MVACPTIETGSGLAALATVLSNGGSAYKHVFFDIQNESDINGPTNKRPLIDYVTAVKNTVLDAGLESHLAADEQSFLDALLAQLPDR